MPMFFERTCLSEFFQLLAECVKVIISWVADFAGSYGFCLRKRFGLCFVVGSI